MPKYRKERVNDEVARVLSDALREVKDPRVCAHLLTVTSCDVSGDLKYAKVYFSAFGAKPEDIKDIKKGLYSAAGYLRHALAERVNLRVTPELTFEYDSAIARGAEVSALFKKTIADSAAYEKAEAARAAAEAESPAPAEEKENGADE